jgi:hypothetical protein
MLQGPKETFFSRTDGILRLVLDHLASSETNSVFCALEI